MPFDRVLLALSQARPPGRAPVLLALRALGLGDLLTAAPALRGLATAFPRHRRVLAAPATMRPLVSLITDGEGRPVVDGLLDTPGLHSPPACAPAVEVAVNLHGRGPESHHLLLSLMPGRLLGFAHPQVAESSGAPRWRAGEHEVQRWCRMLTELGVACDAAELEIDCPSLSSSLPRDSLGATLLHPGAASAARRWPPERWARLAASERAAGRAVLVSGGPRERELAEAVAVRAGLPASSVLAGQLTLRDLAALVGAAGLVVCGDTGVGHLATALGTPSVLLFGPTSPAEWGPPSERTVHRVLWKGLRGDPHADAPDQGLLRIGVREVLEQIADLRAL